MPLISQEEISSNNPPAKELVSQSTEQPQPVRTWSAHGPQSGSSPSPFPRTRDRLTASANSAGELILFGGHVNDSTNSNSRSDLYMFSKRDFSTTLLQTSGDIPTPRSGHGAALIGTTFLVYGGRMEHGHKTIVHFTFSTSARRILLCQVRHQLIKALHSTGRNARVVRRCGQWSRAGPSFFPYRKRGRFQALQLWWLYWQRNRRQ